MMAQSPVMPPLMQNLEFIEHYVDCLENLPLDVQRLVSQIREYDVLYKNKLTAMGRYLCLYQNEPVGPTKKKYLNKVQKCLIKSQHYGDVKLNLISQIVELIDSRSQLLIRDSETNYTDKKEDESKNAGNNNNNIKEKLKVEKTSKSVNEKPTSKSLYDKPKRPRRVRAAEKGQEKTDRSNNNSRASNKPDKEEEDEPMEEDEEPEAKPKKEIKKPKERDVKTKEKEKERPSKEEKEEKEEKKIERKDKNNSGKVTKKTNHKVQSKIKKQKKKKEKELLSEDIPIDPDEPTYCICHRISFGDMIGCDNESCVFEWFHFECVNLTQKPKGKWYCPQCTAERKEKNKK